MFKNLMLYRLGPGWPASAQELEQALAAEPFNPCAATQAKSIGWAPPRGEKHGALVEVVDGQWIARHVAETKSVPADAVRRKVDEAVARLEQTTGRKPGRKERRDLHDDALNALLPHAFARQRALCVWINPVTRVLLVDAASQSAADEVIASLVRAAGQRFEVARLQTNTSPQAAMAAWLADGDGDALHESFHIERECELLGAGDEPARVRFDRHSICTEEVRQHIREGKLPTRLALGWQGRVGFTLTRAMHIKKVAFTGAALEKAAAKPAEDERFDADVCLATGELNGLISDLVDALGGEIKPGFQK